MMFMLEKNFDGRHVLVKAASDGLLIDSMFFPAISEKVILKKEFDPTKMKLP
jgi:hypothetical protein